MKTKILSLIAFLAIALGAHAQFYPGPQLFTTVTNTGVFTVAYIQTTNLLAAQQRIVPIGLNGFAFSATVGATNAAATTNATVVLEMSVDGTNYATHGNGRFSIDLDMNGVTPAVTVTNFNADLCKNFRYVRLYSIQNTNSQLGGGLLFITNMVFGVK